MSNRARQQARASHRTAEIRRQQRARHRRRQLLIAIPATLIVIAAAALAVVLSQHPTGSGRVADTPAVAVGQLAGLGSMATGAPVDGIQCNTSEQDVYHIHVHLAVYVNGTPRTIPARIGIPDSCLYWLHTHDSTGVIHIESPAATTYTLGDLFDIWGQPLTTSQAGPASGTLTAYVNGRRYDGSARAIALRPHDVIQIDIGTNMAPRPYKFAPGL